MLNLLCTLHTQEKDKEKNREKDKETKEKEKKAFNGHLFSPVTSIHSALCQHCNKALNAKDAVGCTSKRSFNVSDMRSRLLCEIFSALNRCIKACCLHG